MNYKEAKELIKINICYKQKICEDGICKGTDEKPCAIDKALEALDIADRLEKADAMSMAIGMECDSCDGGNCQYSEMYCDAVMTAKLYIEQALEDIRGDNE